MPRIPSLNLSPRLDAIGARMAGRSIAATSSNMRRSLLATGGPTVRLATRTMGVGGGMAVRAAGGALRTAGGLATVGLGLGLGVGAAAAVAVGGVAYGAARTFNAAMNTPMIRQLPGNTGAPGYYPTGRPYIDRGGNLLDWQRHGDIPFTKGTRGFHTPMASNHLADMVGAGAVMAGIGGGVASDWRARNWSITQSPQTGGFEVERDNFMGATGSLTLSMYKQRHGRNNIYTGRRVKYNANDIAEMQRRTVQGTVSNLDQVEIAHAIHMAHMGLTG